MSDNNWKWAQSSQNAFQLVGQIFGFNPTEVNKLKDTEVSKALKQADDSDIQVKRIQDYTNATKRHWKNSIKANAMVHGLVRTGLSLMGMKQQQEATTTREYAKAITNTRVQSAKTQTAVEKIYQKGSKQIEKAGKDLERFSSEVNDQYQVIDETANQQSQQRRLGYREKVQKRLASNSRPWRNF